MEHPFLIDLSVKFGLDMAQTVKVVSVLEQNGLFDADSEGFQKAATYICEAELVDEASEVVSMELKRKGLIAE